MQEYKIFYGNRVIILTPKVTKSFEKNDALFYKFTRKEELEELVFAFHNFKYIKELYVFNENPEKLLEYIKSFYKIQEAAGGVVQNSEGKFLCIFRRGVWDLPKGKVEKGEFYKQTAIREVQEECGLKNIELGRRLIDTYHTYQEKGQPILKRTIWYEMKLTKDETPVVQTEEDITDYRWFDSETIGEVLKNTFESLKEVYKSFLYES